MTIDVSTFTFHDVSLWPIVRQSAGSVRSGYAAQWEREMDAMLAISMPFVVIMDGDQAAEDHEDRKVRGIWLKKNKTALAAICRAVIGIEANPTKRVAIQVQMALATKAFGTRMELVASQEEALRLAKRILEGSETTTSPMGRQIP
ncbi:MULTISPECIES: hypothetical protein [unclassified Rhizobium]|uniref:hypothetical protein n=1 Tax=unclassified Rhizobium TaxID=2613769 RepID=UPI001611B1EA|nr:MULTISPECIES: hypothetical protein [unclassified Rhizobium]MBB3285566.1 hypothetical protein [Rhizobium sp. BK252]MBB3400306.1 hypothetical protein [Rhizobium sp. BK289]MBB3412885.1 hypothetical protein [Rhizobium sp. BK284]MBB3480772.1 hypothetical protein [Rhizobium sp. BK347]